MNCETCAFCTPRPPKKTYLQKYLEDLAEWEADPRPVAKWWQSWFKPENYRRRKPTHPYDDDSYFEAIDVTREEGNKILAYCDRFPVRETVRKDYYCGEYKVDKESTKV